MEKHQRGGDFLFGRDENLFFFLTRVHAQFERAAINHTPPQGPWSRLHFGPIFKACPQTPPSLPPSQLTPRKSTLCKMHRGSLNAPSARRFGPAATRVLCSKLSPAGARRAFARDSRFSPKFTQRNRQGFLSRLPTPAPVPHN